MARRKKFVIDCERYIGNHPDGFNVYRRDDTEKLLEYCGVPELNFSFFDLDSGYKFRIGEKKFICSKHSCGKSNGFTRHERIELVEI